MSDVTGCRKTQVRIAQVPLYISIYLSIFFSKYRSIDIFFYTPIPIYSINIRSNLVLQQFFFYSFLKTVFLAGQIRFLTNKIYRCITRAIHIYIICKLFRAYISSEINNLIKYFWRSKIATYFCYSSLVTQISEFI